MQLDLFPEFSSGETHYTGFVIPRFSSPASLEDFLENLSIVDVGLMILGNRMKKQPVGPNYRGLCPFHGEKTPSFYFQVKYNRYQCFGCSARGGPLRLDYKQNEGMLLDEICEKSDLPRSFGWPFITYDFSSRLSSLETMQAQLSRTQQEYVQVIKEAIETERIGREYIARIDLHS